MRVSLYLQHERLKEQHEILSFPSKFPPRFLIHTINRHIPFSPSPWRICTKSHTNQARYATFDGNGSRYRRIPAPTHRVLTLNHISTRDTASRNNRPRKLFHHIRRPDARYTSSLWNYPFEIIRLGRCDISAIGMNFALTLR